MYVYTCIAYLYQLIILCYIIVYYTTPYRAIAYYFTLCNIIICYTRRRPAVGNVASQGESDTI